MILWTKFIRLCTLAIHALNFLAPLMDLAARIWLANVFFRSGWVKISSWSSTLELFDYIYHVPYLPPHVAAYLAASVELGGSALLAMGLGGRFAATALFILNATAVISYPDLSASGLEEHFFWGLLLLLFIFHGPGKLSLDTLIQNKLMNKKIKT
ncbi:MAG: DoxX family protein [Pseudomonadota bacterium]|nr:DoxX family protein [Pseudomonadota bacterium]